MQDYTKLKTLIEKHRDNGIEFGTELQQPSEEQIKATEHHLGFSLPPSYVWFLKNFGGGELFGNEIYSIYSNASDTEPSGDIVFNYRNHLKHGLIKEKQLPIMQSDFGELFYIDAAQQSGVNEYPVMIMRGKEIERYAENFGQFLFRFISDA